MKSLTIFAIVAVVTVGAVGFVLLSNPGGNDSFEGIDYGPGFFMETEHLDDNGGKFTVKVETTDFDGKTMVIKGSTTYDGIHYSNVATIEKVSDTRYIAKLSNFKTTGWLELVDGKWYLGTVHGFPVGENITINDNQWMISTDPHENGFSLIATYAINALTALTDNIDLSVTDYYASEGTAFTDYIVMMIRAISPYIQQEFIIDNEGNTYDYAMRCGDVFVRSNDPLVLEHSDFEHSRLSMFPTLIKETMLLGSERIPVYVYRYYEDGEVTTTEYYSADLRLKYGISQIVSNGDGTDKHIYYILKDTNFTPLGEKHDAPVYTDSSLNDELPGGFGIGFSFDSEQYRYDDDGNLAATYTLHMVTQACDDDSLDILATLSDGARSVDHHVAISMCDETSCRMAIEGFDRYIYAKVVDGALYYWTVSDGENLQEYVENHSGLILTYDIEGNIMYRMVAMALSGFNSLTWGAYDMGVEHILNGESIGLTIMFMRLTSMSKPYIMADDGNLYRACAQYTMRCNNPGSLVIEGDAYEKAFFDGSVFKIDIGESVQSWDPSMSVLLGSSNFVDGTEFVCSRLVQVTYSQ